jgi:hypothetical protein
MEFHGQTEVALCKLRVSCHFCLSPFGLKVKNFHRPTGCILITKDIDKMARMAILPPQLLIENPRRA